MSEYPDHQTYRALYKKYAEGRDVAELGQLLEPLLGTRVLDLCGGEGDLTCYARNHGAEFVTLVDASVKMPHENLHKDPRVRTITGDATDTLRRMIQTGTTFNRAVCRQAINYWLDEDSAEALARVLCEGALFVFNTFNQRPSRRPRVIEYTLDSHFFTEVSWLTGDDMVHHVQVRDGFPPHTTEFRWLSREKINSFLEPYFHIQETVREKTSIYRCIRK